MTKIQGEETIDIPILNGIDPSFSPESAVYNQTMINLLQKDNQLQIRDDYLLLMEIGKTPRAIPVTSPVPVNIGAKDVEVFSCSGSQTVDSPSILFCFDDGTTRDVTWINCNATSPISTTQTMSVAARGVKAFCQYRDRYYASNFTSTVFRMSNFVTGGPTITVTDLFAQAGINILVTFKNRIFGMATNRIYYTDLPAIGGYPETWSAAVNFIDLPTTDFDVTIYSVIPYKDKLYLFTNRGIYLLTANGDVTNWSVQVVSSDFSVFNKDSVCVNKNIIFFTNQHGVFSFDGSSFKDITGSISGAWTMWNPTFYIYQQARLFPYEDGVVLEYNAFGNNVGNYVVYGSARTFYYNMKIWVEITSGISATNQQSSFLKIGIGLVPFRGRTPTTWMAYKHRDASVGNLWRIIIVDKNRWSGDCFNTNWASARTQKQWQLVGPSFYMLHDQRIRVKYFEIYLYYIESVYAISAQGNDSPFNPAGNSLTPADYPGFFNSRWRVPVSGQVRSNRITIYMIGSSSVASSSNGGNEIPTVIFKVVAVVNTDNIGSDARFTR